MQIGIIPDILLCRTATPLTEDMRRKIALFCNVSEKNVISAVDIKGSIYEIPDMLHGNGYDTMVLNHFGIKGTGLNLAEWDKFMTSLRNPSRKVTIAVVGKYIALQDAYRSIYEALIHGAAANNAELVVKRIDSEDIEKEFMNDLPSLFSEVGGILIPGGFGDRGIEGKIAAINYARTEKIPLFGICLGLHCAAAEFARNACGLNNANSTEINPLTPYPVISLLEDQENIEQLGGTMRLGAYQCRFKIGTKIEKIYGSEHIMERHRHRYEFAQKYQKIFEDNGMICSGINPKTNLVETIELADHPWFICTQYHPEFKSKPTRPHPLFRDFIRASIENIKKD
jgi:CTP synthase